jgi:preprotein translocase subunit SecE
MNRQQRRQMRRQEQGSDPDRDDPVGASGLGDVDPADIEVDGVPLVEETFASEPESDADPGTGGRRSAGSEALAPRQHTGPRQFLHEVNVEMRKVAWPSRAETINYSTVVFVTLAVLMALIFGLDDGFSHAANFLFNP